MICLKRAERLGTHKYQRSGNKAQEVPATLNQKFLVIERTSRIEEH